MLIYWKYRHQDDIDELLNQNSGHEKDYFDCSNLLKGVAFPGLSSQMPQDEIESFWGSEKLSSHFQKEDEMYFMDEYESAQKMDPGFY